MGKENEEKEYTDEEVAELEAKSMQSGFDRVMGDEPTVTTDKVATKEEAPPDEKPDSEAEASEEAKAAEEAKAEETAKAATQKLQDGLPDRLRKIEGTLGGILNSVESTIKKAMSESTAKAADLPSQKEIVAALKDPEAMATLIDGYPEFAPLSDEAKDMRQELAKQDSRVDEKIAASEQKVQKEAKERQDAAAIAELDSNHEGWLETAHSDEFKEWALEGGPSLAGYNYVTDLAGTAQAKGETSQEADIIVKAWARDFPDWWSNKGTNLFGDIKDSLTILDEYKADSKDDSTITDVEKEEAKRLRRQKRKESTTTVDGKPSSPAPGLNDLEAFNFGFDKINKNRIGR